MKRLGVATMVLGLFVAGCGGKAGSLGPAPSGSPAPGPSITPPSPTGTPTASPSSSPGRPFTFQVWLVRGGRLFVTRRTEPLVPAVGQLALDALVAGPNALELAASVRSEIPPGVAADITALAGGVATVDLDPQFFQATASGSALRRGQVVYTLTQYSTISSVSFTRGGTAVDGHAWSRRDFAALLPAITVESPTIGQRVSSPVTVAGTANVFEATVSFRILDASGNEIARTFTQASCGTGCRGDYSVSVPFTIGSEQPGTIEVYEVSAKDGSAINVVDIPVILIP
jgi:hypothetical protein